MDNSLQIENLRGLSTPNHYGEGLFEQARDADTFFLDELIPLQSASHADVVRYSIDIPMRYAECFGVLANGDKVPFENCRQFVGWSGHEAKRSILFEASGLRIEIGIDPTDRVGRNSPGKICSIDHESIAENDKGHENLTSKVCRKFIAVDGSLFSLPG